MKTLILLLALATPAFSQVTPATPAGVSAGTGGAGAGVGVGAGAGKAKALNAGDKKFVKDALDGMYYEMDLAGKAKTSAAIEGTKTVANTLKADLDKVWADVAGIASTYDEKIPMALAGGDKAKAEKLGKTTGSKFDKEFLKIVNHESDKLAKAFESAAKMGADPEVKRIAGQWAPTLKDHAAKIDAAEKEAAKAK